MVRPMRRKDRIMAEDDIQRVLNENSHGVLATISEDGTPYSVPVSYVYHKGSVYFHSASAGHKVDNIARDNNICFTVIGKVKMQAVPKSDAYFESVIIFGNAVRVTDFEEQLSSMTELMKIFMPDKVHETENDLRKMQKAFFVYRVDARHVSGKIRKPSGEKC